MQVLLRRKDLVDVVGILGKGGQHSLECSTKYNIPLYTSVSELPSGIDLACVIVRAGVMGGEGIQLSKELLQKGISVLHGLKLSYEAPKDKINKEILDFLKENKSEIIKLLLNDTTEKWNSMGIYESKSFPLTDTQAAYLMGREECFSYGNVGCHIYFEIEYSCLDFNQVQNVWNELLERHEMLRMEITADKKQIISEIVPKNIVTFWDTTNETEDQILSMVREKFGNKQYNIYKAPLFDVGVISREKKNDILFLSVTKLRFLYWGADFGLQEYSINFRF